MLVIAGVVKVKPEVRAEAIQAAVKMAQATRQEAGCITYGFSADLEDPNTFLIFEQWKDEAALMSHFQSPHMAEFNGLIPRYLAAPPSINRFDVSNVSKLM